MPMKRKSPTPLVLFPSEKPQNSNEYNWSGISTEHRERRRSVFSYIKRAAKKVAGAFTIVFLGRRKSSPEDCRSEPGRSFSPDTESCFSGSTDYLSDSYSRGPSKSNLSGSNRLPGSGSRYSQSSASSTRRWHLGPVIFSFEEIQEATANFASVHEIGKGGFGTVYKGRLKDGTLVSIKRARKNSYNESSLLEFKNEIYTLSKIEHMNLVRLYGFLEHEGERIIVVEYVGNGNLREHLDGSRGNRLEMAERLEIAIDVAHAITYLHTYTDTPIIHRDIKATNILITEKLRAKVADFGLARLVSEDPGATHISTQVKGSAGYVDPDYLRTFQLTEKSDVYSFGVVLVELVSGRRPIDSKRPRRERMTVKWAMRRLRENEVVFVMDPVLRKSRASITAAEKIMKLACECLAPSRSSRPTMKTSAETLWEIRKEFRETQLPSSSALQTPTRDIA